MSGALTWHRIWHLGHDVDTDALAPGAYMQHGIDVIASHCLEAVVPGFARDVRRGDVIVAGEGFGIGSSREQAAAALVHLGVAAVIAPSYGGLFFRNAYNLGLLLLTCPQAGLLAQEARLGLEPDALTLHTEAGRVLQAEPVPEFLLRMARAGGLMAVLRQRAASSQATPPNPMNQESP